MFYEIIVKIIPDQLLSLQQHIYDVHLFLFLLRGERPGFDSRQRWE